MVATVQLRPCPGEPAVRAWTAIPAAAFADRVAGAAPQGRERSMLVGIDGRSGGGKTTVAQSLGEHLGDAQVVHTDDVAWYDSMFGWDDLLAEHVLQPLRNRVTVRY